MKNCLQEEEITYSNMSITKNRNFKISVLYSSLVILGRLKSFAAYSE